MKLETSPVLSNRSESRKKWIILVYDNALSLFYKCSITLILPPKGQGNYSSFRSLRFAPGNVTTIRKNHKTKNQELVGRSQADSRL
jgi:hypothetical protein